MFHCTPKGNLKRILKEGLLPNRPDIDDKQNAPGGVYLSEHPFAWMHYVTFENKEAGALIEVDVKGLKLTKDTNKCFFDQVENATGLDIPKSKDYVCPEPIPVERFVRISVSTDKRPTFFEEFKFRNSSN